MPGGEPRRYYFVSFLWRTIEHVNWIPSDAVIDEHPLAFSDRAWETYGRSVAGFEIRLTFFHELTESEYERFK